MADKFPTPDTIRMLKAVVEGSTTPKEWNAWLRGGEKRLCDHEISRGGYVRLKFHPLIEARKLLDQHGVSFTPSDALEFLDNDVRSGRCRECGARIERAGRYVARCSAGCWVFHAKPGPQRDRN